MIQSARTALTVVLAIVAAAISAAAAQTTSPKVGIVIMHGKGGSLPRNPRTRLYEPNASHLEAPSASADEILQWTSAIAGAK